MLRCCFGLLPTDGFHPRLYIATPPHGNVALRGSYAAVHREVSCGTNGCQGAISACGQLIRAIATDAVEAKELGLKAVVWARLM